MINTKRLQALSGASFRQITHWAQRGWLKSREGIDCGSGVYRTYADREVDVALCLKALSDMDMLGSKGRGRNTDYLDSLLDHVRAHGLMGDWHVGFVTLHLDDLSAFVGAS